MTLAEEKFYRARITRRQDISPDLWKIHLDPGGEFPFSPGQFATLGVETPAKHFERAYSIVSAPFEKEIEIYIELVQDGDLTPLLYKLQVGGVVTLRKVAKGRFTLDTQSGHKNHLLLCTVTGVAPFISYTRSLYKDWKEKKFAGEHHLYLINGASRSWEFGYREEIERIAGEVPWLKYVPTVSRPYEDTAWHGETGRVEEIIRKYTDLWQLSGADTSSYLCGHPKMIEHGKGILQRRGFAKGSLKEEVYWITGKDPQS